MEIKEKQKAWRGKKGRGEVNWSPKGLRLKEKDVENGREENSHGGLEREAVVGKQGQCLCLSRLCHCGILEDRGALCV